MSFFPTPRQSREPLLAVTAQQTLLPSASTVPRHLRHCRVPPARRSVSWYWLSRARAAASFLPVLELSLALADRGSRGAAGRLIASCGPMSGCIQASLAALSSTVEGSC